MRVLIDAMGGDNAPGAIVRGAVMAAREFGAEIVLIGREESIRACLSEAGAADEPLISVVNAAEVITMEDDPANATRRKKDSSMSVMLRMMAAGEADACVSAGSTGALLSGATLTVKRIRGIRRACFAPVLPNGGRGVMIIDSGANVECTAEYLLQFGYMGSFYARRIMGCENPRVGLLNNGAEESKGTPLQKAAYALLQEAHEAGHLNFIGNVEAGDLMNGGVDVLVCDGFSGNVLLKSVEGTAKFLMKGLKGIFLSSAKNKLAALLVKKDMKSFKAQLDVSEVGGTALLGISRPVIKAHGSSDERAVRSAVRQAIAFAQSGIIESIEQDVSLMRVKMNEQQ